MREIMKNKEKQAQSLPIANKTNPSRPILNIKYKNNFF